MNTPRKPEALEEEIELLVDGELEEDERAALFRRLDGADEARGWKRCALALLEAQAWRSAMECDPPVPKVRMRVRRLAPALSVVAAALMGFLAAAMLVKPWEAEATAEADAADATGAAEVQYVPYPVVEYNGFVAASDERGNRYYRTQGDVPEFFLRALREAGHDIRRIERVVAVPREDDEPLRLPMTETRVFVNLEL